MGEGLILWDNKSSEQLVNLASHLKQFDSYIKASDKKVECFLVIAPDFTADSTKTAMDYFVRERVMFSLIKASDLKEVAERYKNTASEESFSLRYLVQPGAFNADLVQFS